MGSQECSIGFGAKMAKTGAAPAPQTRNEILFDKIQELVPQNDSQRALKSQVESMAFNLGQMRWLLFEQSGSSISTPFLVVVVFWLSTLFVSFGLFAPRNATAFFTLLISALGGGSVVSDTGARSSILRIDSDLQRAPSQCSRSTWKVGS